MKKQEKNRIFVPEFIMVGDKERREIRPLFFEKIMAGLSMSDSMREEMFRIRFRKTNASLSTFTDGVANSKKEHKPMRRILTFQDIPKEKREITLWFIGDSVGAHYGSIDIKNFVKSGIQIRVSSKKYWISNSEIFFEISKKPDGSLKYPWECLKFVNECGFDSVEQFMQRYHKATDLRMYVLSENSFKHE